MRGRAVQIFQRHLSQRFMPCFEIKLGKRFAWIPETLRRVFLEQTGRKRYAFAGRFEQRGELPQRDRALLTRAEIKRMIFAHAGMPFALTSLARGALAITRDCCCQPRCANAARVCSRNWARVARRGRNGTVRSASAAD